MKKYGIVYELVGKTGLYSFTKSILGLAKSKVNKFVKIVKLLILTHPSNTNFA
jgi:hypothetical protein